MRSTCRRAKSGKIGGGVAGHNGLRSHHRAHRQRLSAGAHRRRSSRQQGYGLCLCAQRFCQERARLGRGARSVFSPTMPNSWSAARTRAFRTRSTLAMAAKGFGEEGEQRARLSGIPGPTLDTETRKHDICGMKNVTITLSENLARRARVEAAKQDKSLSRFVADLLEERCKADEPKNWPCSANSSTAPVIPESAKPGAGGRFSMPNGKMNCFADTNLHRSTPSIRHEPEKQSRARQDFLNRIINRHTLVLSPQSLNECYRAVTVRARPMPRIAEAQPVHLCL